MSALLELQDVEARYGPVQALRGVSLAVPEGSVVAVLGANGAGKTTTLRAVSGTVRRSGDILLGGKPLRGGPEAAAKAGIAHVPETARRVVVLPAPFAPSTATTDPSGTSSEIPRSACTGP